MKDKVVSNILWRFFERMGAQVIEFLVTIILARILGPEAYGDVAIITAITTILQVFVDSGLGNSLIQKKDADNLDYSTVFFFNVCFCVVVYIFLFLGAPLIAAFYGKPQLSSMIRIASILVLISGIKNIQQAIITKNMEFKKFFFATLLGTIVSAICGIYMAVLGFGAWALIWQLLINAFIDTVVVWLISGWLPEKIFSFKRLKGLLAFGSKLLASILIDSIYGNIRQLIIGKIYSSNDLAYYNRGRALPNAIVKNINTSIDSVLFPVMSNSQDKIDEVKQITRKAILTSNYLMAPLMMGMLFSSEVFIEFLLTEAWLPCIPYLRVFCIIFMMQPIHTANTNAIKAIGRSDLLLKIEICKKCIGLTILFICMDYGMRAIIYGYLFNNFLDQIINSWPNRKLFQYKYHEQIRDILPSTVLAVFMGYCISKITFGDSLLVILFCRLGAGIFIYLIISLLLKLEAYCAVMDMISSFLKKGRKNASDSNKDN